MSEALADVMHRARPAAVLEQLEPQDDNDLQIALWTLYELSYRGFEDADDTWESDPTLIALRGRLERDLESRWRGRAAAAEVGEPFERELTRLIDEDEGASVAAAVHSDAGRDHVLELLRLRSVYHLKEADPTSWTLPRLPERSQAALAACNQVATSVPDIRRRGEDDRRSSCATAA